MKRKQEETLSAYLDGQLSAEEAKAFEAEAQNDEALRLELEKSQAVLSLLDSYPAVEPSPTFDADFYRKLRQAQAEDTERQTRRPWWQRWTVHAAFGGAAVACAFAFVLAVKNKPDVTSNVPGGNSPSQVADINVQDVVANLDMLEDIDVIENLDMLESLDGKGLDDLDLDDDAGEQP